MKPQFPVLLLAGGALCLAPFALAAPALPAQTIALPAAKTAEAPALYGAWRSAQIGGGGYVQNVISTRAPGVFYAYVDVGGVYRSDDGGKRWRMIHGGLPASSSAYYMRDLSVNPTNENDVVIATGDQWTSGGGFFRTLDGGKTWKKTGEAQFYGNENGRWMGAALARDASNPKRIWGASQGGGVWQSLDGGATWKLLGLEGVWCVDVDVDRSNSNRLLVSAQSNKVWRGQTQVEIAGGFYLSQDGGATWKKLLDDGPTEIVQDASDAKIFYGIFESRLVRRSRDGGLTWQDFSDGLPISDKDQREEYNSTASFNALASGPDFLVVGANKGVFYRLDKGQTKWRKIEREGATENYEGRPWFARMEPGKWQHFGAALASITIDPRNPKRWFFTDWFAIYRSEDAGKHWDLSMDGVEVTVLHTLLPDPSDAGAVHLGMADNGYFLSLDGGASFDKPNSFSNCKSLAIAPVLPARVYGTGDRGNGQWRASQLWVSTDRAKVGRARRCSVCPTWTRTRAIRSRLRPMIRSRFTWAFPRKSARAAAFTNRATAAKVGLFSAPVCPMARRFLRTTSLASAKKSPPKQTANWPRFRATGARFTLLTAKRGSRLRSSRTRRCRWRRARPARFSLRCETRAFFVRSMAGRVGRTFGRAMPRTLRPTRRARRVWPLA